MWKKEILARTISIQKENWGWGGGVTAHFSEEIELKFGKTFPYIQSLYFNAFLELWLLNYL